MPHPHSMERQGMLIVHVLAGEAVFIKVGDAVFAFANIHTCHGM